MQEAPTQPRKSPSAKRVTMPSQATFLRSVPRMTSPDQMELLEAIVTNMEDRKRAALANGDLAQGIRELIGESR